MAVRAATSGELAKFRADGQKQKRYLAIRKPSAVYTAHLTTPYPASNDMVASITYNTGVGTLANVLIGMDMYVGSSAGGSEYGVCRIRKAPTGTVFHIAEGSDIDWVAAGANIGLGQTVYLTIVNEHGLWARHIKIVGSVPKMDYDIAYSDQHTNFDPVVLMGSDIVLWLTGATVSFTWPTVAGSYDPSGVATIAGYAWTFPGASATSNLTTATPTATYNAAGQYKAHCTITLSNGKSFTANRTIFVYSATSMPEINFAVTSEPKGTYEGGGWGFEVELYANADFTNILDRAKVILFSKDYYGDTEGSIGPVVGSENIICSGWIVGDTIQQDSETGKVTFRVEGAQSWLKRIPSFPVGLERVVGASTAWTNIKKLTPRLMLWHLLHWRSTTDAIMDVNLTSDTRQMKSLDTQQANLWAQITAVAHDQILADPIVDRYGALNILVFQQYVPTAGRSSYPQVMILTKADWKDTLDIQRRSVSENSRVELSGVVIGGGVAKALFSLAPGHVFKRYGEIINADYLLLTTQAQANEMAGMILAHGNRSLEFDFSLAQNNRLFDIAPRSFAYITVLAGDTARGIAYAGRLVITEVEYACDENGSPTTNIHAEQETFPELYQNGDIPPNPIPPTPIPPEPPVPPIPPGGGITPVPTADGPAHVAISTAAHGIWYTDTFNTSDPEWFSWNAGLNPTDFPYFWKFEMSMVAPHRGFLHICDFSKSEIWTSPSPGSTWTKIADNAAADAVIPHTFASLGGWICSFGLNRSSDDECMTMIGCFGGAVTRDMISAGLNHGGFTGVKGAHTGLPPAAVPADSVFIGTGWLVGFVEGFPQFRVKQVDRSGGYGIDTSLSIYSGAQMNDVLINPALSGLITCHPGSGGAYGKTINGGATFSLVTSPPACPALAWRHETAGFDPTGLYWLASNNTGFGKKSSDGGVTWASVGIVGVIQSVWNCGDQNSWIAAIIGQIQYSADFATSFTQKTGDLQDVTSALVDITAIRAYDDLV